MVEAELVISLGISEGWHDKGRYLSCIVGTALMTLIMAVAAVPFGVITAVYLAEYASEKSIFAKTIRFAVKTLAVVPSIIFGLFGLGFFIGFIGKNMDTLFSGGELKWGQPNILWASLTMALLTLPVVIVSVEEAIRTIPGRCVKPVSPLEPPNGRQ